MSEGNGSEVPGAVGKVLAQVIVTMTVEGQIGCQYNGPSITCLGLLRVAQDLVIADSQKPKSAIIVPKPNVNGLRIQP